MGRGRRRLGAILDAGNFESLLNLLSVGSHATHSDDPVAGHGELKGIGDVVAAIRRVHFRDDRFHPCQGLVAAYLKLCSGDRRAIRPFQRDNDLNRTNA